MQKDYIKILTILVDEKKLQVGQKSPMANQMQAKKTSYYWRNWWIIGRTNGEEAITQ